MCRFDTVWNRNDSIADFTGKCFTKSVIKLDFPKIDSIKTIHFRNWNIKWKCIENISDLQLNFHLYSSENWHWIFMNSMGFWFNSLLFLALFLLIQRECWVSWIKLNLFVMLLQILWKNNEIVDCKYKCNNSWTLSLTFAVKN